MTHDACARVRIARAGPRQDLRATFSDAGREPREHDIERFPDHRDRALSRLRYRRIGLGAAARWHRRFRPEPGRRAVSATRPTPLFVAPYAGVGTVTFNFIDDDAVIARYGQNGHPRRAECRSKPRRAKRSACRRAMSDARPRRSRWAIPGFPELRGKETGAEIVWRLDTQDSPVVPSRRHAVGGPTVAHLQRPGCEGEGKRHSTSTTSLTQLSAAANRFWSVGSRNRVFVYGGLGTSFDDAPLPTEQFALGTPFRLGAYNAGELRGPHYYIATGGYLRRIGRLPDFIGGPCSREAGSRTATPSTNGRTPAGGQTAAPAWSWTRSSDRSSWRLLELRRALAHVSGCRTDLSLRSE